MKLSLVAPIVLFIAGCGAHTAPPATTPPGPAIIALAKPILVAPQPTVQVMESQEWSVTLPADWTVAEPEVSPEATMASAINPEHNIEVDIISTDIPETMDAAAFNIVTALNAVHLVPDGFDVVQDRNGLIDDSDPSKGNVSVIITQQGFAVGVLAVPNEATHRGFTVACGAMPGTAAAGKLCDRIAHTFKMK